MRLRPSGNKGPVATSLASFELYHRDSAWTWEKTPAGVPMTITSPGSSVSTRPAARWSRPRRRSCRSVFASCITCAVQAALDAQAGGARRQFVGGDQHRAEAAGARRSSCRWSIAACASGSRARDMSLKQAVAEDVVAARRPASTWRGTLAADDHGQLGLVVELVGHLRPHARLRRAPTSELAPRKKNHG